MNPLATLRYSATHIDKHQMVYRLDAVDAYERGLVKQIEVASLEVDGGFNKPYVKLVEAKGLVVRPVGSSPVDKLPSPEEVSAQITDKSRVLIITHVFGAVYDASALIREAQSRGVCCGAAAPHQSATTEQPG